MSEKVTVKVERNILHLPAIALRGLVVFPNNLLHFEVGRDKSIAAVEWAVRNKSEVFLIAQKDMKAEDPKAEEMYQYGVVAEIKQVMRVSDDLVRILVEGKFRAKRTELDTEGSFLLASVRPAPVRPIKAEEETEAEALLAGMVLDTKQFTMRTGSRTFEAAAFLRRSGADTGDVKKLFQNDLEGTIAKYDIIQNAKMYHEGIAVAKVDHTVGRITAAQAADELLNISGIDTSFVLFPDQEGRVILSARSMGDVNVQVVLEKLGGGGNAATAGAQVPGKGVDEVNDMLLQAIDAYLEEE